MAKPTLDNLYNALIENGPNKPEVVMALSALYGHGRNNDDVVTPKMIDSIVRDFNPKSIYRLLDQSQFLLLMGDKMGGVKEGGVIDGIKRDSEDLFRTIYTNLNRSPAENDFGVPFGTILHKETMNLAVITTYKTDGYEVRGGLFPEILTFTRTCPPGVLCFQGASKIPKPEEGFFCSCDKETYDRNAEKLKVIPPGKNKNY